MSLPPVIFFERHWDSTPKSLLQKTLPALAELGYDTICVEAPHTLSSQDLMTRFEHNLQESSKLLHTANSLLRQRGIQITHLCAVPFAELVTLMRSYVSSQRFQTVAERIKQLPAVESLKNLLDIALAKGISLQGIDAPQVDDVISVDLSQRMSRIIEHDTCRTDTMFARLSKLSIQKGVLFLCGAMHAETLISRCKEQNLEISYYFPYGTTGAYDRDEETISDLISLNPCLRTNILKVDHLDTLKDRIIAEIHSKIVYTPLQKTSHTDYLNSLFHDIRITFTPILRSGFYVDAIAEIDSPTQFGIISATLQEKKVPIRRSILKGKDCVVIPCVNTTQIASKLS